MGSESNLAIHLKSPMNIQKKHRRKAFLTLTPFVLMFAAITYAKNVVPPAREGHSAVYDSANNQMIVFGGWNSDDGCFSDTWVFDINKRKWDKIILTEESPSARWNHSAVYDPVNKQMIVFGGRNERGELFNDTWTYNIEKKTWEEVKTEESPPARAGHSTVYDSANKCLIVFGGMKSGNIKKRFDLFSDIWIFDIEGKNWEQMSLPEGPDKVNNVPSPRCNQSAVYDSINKQMIICGGLYYKVIGVTGPFDDLKVSCFSDTWIFDIEKKNWNEIKTIPFARYNHSAIYDENHKQMIIFGGRSDKEFFSNVLSFNIEQKTLKEIKTKNATVSKSGHTAIYEPLTKQIIVFGGQMNNFVHSSSTMVFNIKKRSWQEIK